MFRLEDEVIEDCTEQIEAKQCPYKKGEYYSKYVNNLKGHWLNTKVFTVLMINVNDTNNGDNQPRTSSQASNSPRLPSFTVKTPLRACVAKDLAVSMQQKRLIRMARLRIQTMLMKILLNHTI